MYYSRVGRGSRAPFGRRLASRGLSEYSCHAHPVCREHKAVSHLLLLLLIPCSQRLYNMPAAANATPRCPVRSMTQGASMGVGGTPWPLTRPLLPHLVSRPHGLYFKHCWAGRQPELQICLTEYFNVRPLVRGRRWLPRLHSGTAAAAHPWPPRQAALQDTSLEALTSTRRWMSVDLVMTEGPCTRSTPIRPHIAL